ncbi:MAG: FAD-linked oxidase C-terminal domain-containing protein [Balneolaceae bacterium]
MPEILTDSLTRHLYANDASMYEELPRGVAFPASAGDLQELVKASKDGGFPVTLRSAGTSLAGQATGSGVVIDVSRHMTGILSVDPENRQARVQPGVIRDTLNRQAALYGLQFGPDTSTTNRSMIGGMIGNNSSGSFSVKHKTTREHIVEIEAVLSDGSTTVFKPLTGPELEAKCRLDNLEGEIYRGMLRLLKENREEIFQSYPHPEIIRRNTGYALDRLCEMDPVTPGGRPFNLAELLCGSEGTLAVTASAVVRLVPLDPHRILVIPQFKGLTEAMEAAVDAVELEASAVELVDDIILQATRGNIEQKKNRFFLEGDPRCILIIQFDGNDPVKLREKADALASRLENRGLGYTWPVISDEIRMDQVWDLRKAGLGLLMGLSQDSRTPTFVEDTAVRVRNLPAYVADFRKLLEKYDTNCVFYAHASVGELHLRPVIDITTTEGLGKMKAMAEDVAVLVRKYRGSLSGEHGDGRARAPYIEKVLGSRMMPLLKQVKELWDKDHRFNPGKIINAKPIDSNLRFSPGQPKVEPETLFNWRREKGFGNALEQCNGAGTCRKRAESGGTMCPSYHATLEEKDSTRGRANLFRQIFLSRQQDAFTSAEIKEGLELCLSCKACKSECPANVDMAKMKAEFFHGRHKQMGVPFLSRFFGEPEKFYPLASALSPLSNFFLRRQAVRNVLQEMIGVDARRTLPLFAGQTFRAWFEENRDRFRRGNRPRVALLVDLFTNYHEPGIARSACRVLDRLGYDVLVPGSMVTGRPQISRGLLEKARTICARNLEALHPLVRQGIPVVGLEPSELLTLRDEYPDLCSDGQLEMAEQLAENSWLFEEFLAGHFAKHPEQGRWFYTGRTRVALHGHCHTKALSGNGPLMQVLEQCGFGVTDMKTGCCGMAGSFGYEHYDVSMKIGEQILFPAARDTDPSTLICAPGFSCRHQIADGTGRKAFHPAVILDKALLDEGMLDKTMDRLQGVKEER